MSAAGSGRGAAATPLAFRVSAPSAGDVEAAAELWARTTTVRDSELEVPGLERSLPLIEDAMSSSRSLLLLAGEPDGRLLAFAAAQPLSGEGEETANVRYVAVHPDVWGRGIGSALMAALRPELLALGYRRAELWARAENSRAIAMYERAGWRRTGRRDRHPQTGRMRCYLGIDL